MRVAFLFVILMFFSYATVAADLKACGHHDYAPWNWKKGGEIVGVCAEITKTLMGDLGLTVDLAYRGPWKRCQKNIENGWIDINICSFINENRQQYSDFVMTPVGINENAVFVAKAHQFSFETWPDLKGKTAGMVAGVSLGQRFDDFIKENLRVQQVNEYLQIFKMLEVGRIDFVPTGRHSGKAMLRAYGLDDQLTDLPTPILYGNLYISMSKKSQYISLLPEIEKALRKKSHTVWVDGLIEKYTKIYAEDYVKESEKQVTPFGQAR
ncbi:substrate-binding periplasmic protein [Alkalimarinus alittae]|uniref:Transporter substrate-binding domain-containing protein n=1 Tax=Alkalimarinus alittae TaxID=2961619 RepID=A0ABY6N322_9ALTE|nr:transporter substrate-binding domain-containing protein [Alkalimarinus alittae]UZE96397.1 transporter substrate-binding domain-containing protein [Alkalimarinus alittae]